MSLQTILERYPRHNTSGVPEWMLGCFRRQCISFANGESDHQTTVYWLQSRHLTIDLRLPRFDQRVTSTLLDRPASDWQALSQYEGWSALAHWDGQQLSWSETTALQNHNRWPEPACLRRVGNCMIEFAPSGAYVEDWRLQPSEPGPLIGLRLREETRLDTGERIPRDGALIIAGRYAGLVLGRTQPLPDSHSTLTEQVNVQLDKSASPAPLFDFETSIAEGSLTQGFTVQHSTRPERCGNPLWPESDFEWLPDQQQVRQRWHQGDHHFERRFDVDSLEPHYPFKLSTPSTPESNRWFEQEAATLTRYTRHLF